MSEGAWWASGCFAAGGFSAAGDLLALMLRLLIAGGALILGWFLAAPVARLLYRLAFHQPIPPKVLTGSRLGASFVCAVLVFLIVHFGSGGGGGGSGGGTGPGVGPGSHAGNDKGGKDGKGKETELPKPGETVRVELIRSDRYKKD